MRLEPLIQLQALIYLLTCIGGFNASEGSSVITVRCKEMKMLVSWGGGNDGCQYAGSGDFMICLGILWGFFVVALVCFCTET